MKSIKPNSVHHRAAAGSGLLCDGLWPGDRRQNALSPDAPGCRFSTGCITESTALFFFFPNPESCFALQVF